MERRRRCALVENRAVDDVGRRLSQDPRIRAVGSEDVARMHDKNPCGATYLGEAIDAVQNGKAVRRCERTVNEAVLQVDVHRSTHVCP